MRVEIARCHRCLATREADRLHMTLLTRRDAGCLHDRAEWKVANIVTKIVRDRVAMGCILLTATDFFNSVDAASLHTTTLKLFLYRLLDFFLDVILLFNVLYFVLGCL